MHSIFIIVHIIVAVTLILIVLLQTGKGSSVGAAFGGGSSGTVFGSRGPAPFLSKITAVAAIVFMLTSLSLSIISSQKLGPDTVMDGMTPAAQQESTEPPVEQAPPVEAPAQQAEPIQPAGSSN